MKILKKAKNDHAQIFFKAKKIPWYSKTKELEFFVNEINDSEKILVVATGKLTQFTYDYIPRNTNYENLNSNTKGIMVITTDQIVFMNRQIFGKQTTVINSEDIKDFKIELGTMNSKIIIFTYGVNYSINNVKKGAAIASLEAIQKIQKLSNKNKNFSLSTWN